MKVLVVEDTATTAAVLVRHLEALGFDAIVAKNGEEGVAAFVREHPDIVLLDILLPGIDGIEVARRIRAQERDGEWTPVIYLSAKHDDAAIEAGLSAGGDDYLTKPISPVVLTAKLRAMQRLAQAQKSLLLLTQRLDEANRRLQEMVHVDGLTGVANRRAFDARLSEEWRRCARLEKPLTLLLFDVDYFKRYNDSRGHLAGDDALKRVAQALSGALQRPGDLLARYGGEEFAAVLPEVDDEGGKIVAERMRAAVAALRIPHPDSPIGRTISVSIGGASALPGKTVGVDSPAVLLDLADRALYRAKAAGRNRAVVLPAAVLRGESEAVTPGA
uniref:diguanylate cyclase n=1 Tax=uncultured beta proteobacterium TaxID=86027 RepID=H5S9T5_9PROT|nr:two-component system, PleD family, response regulator WspR [uncultured beta proteobacterium]